MIRKLKEMFWSHCVTLFILALAGFIIYSNTFYASFHFDDLPTIVNNQAIRTLDINSIWNAFNTRFLTGLSLALNYQFGKLNVFGFHIFNITVHILVSFLVYQFTITSFETPLLSRHPIAHKRTWLGLVAALIFLAHPIQTQAVNYIWQRSTLMASGFYLLSIIFYAKSRMSSSKLLCFFSLISAILGMLSKEIVFTLPFVIVAYEYLFLSDLKNKKIKRLTFLIPFVFLLLIIPAMLLRNPEITIIGGYQPSDVSKSLWNIDLTTRDVPEEIMPRHVYLLTQIDVLRTYLRLIIIPINQNFEYDYPLTYSIFKPGTIISLALLFSIIAIGVTFFKKHRFPFFCIFFFFIAMSIESLIPLIDVIWEHRLYLPMIGVSMLLSYWLVYIFKEKYSLIAIIVFLTFLYGCMAYQRNYIWQDEISLWTDVVKKSPNKPRVYNSRGNAYLVHGHIDEAITDYNKAIELDSNYAEAFNNLGLAYEKINDVDNALLNFNKAIQINPNYAAAYYNLGNVYLDQNQFSKARINFDQTIKIKPNFVNAYINRGITFLSEKLYDQSIDDFDRAIRLQPDNSTAFNARGNAYQRKNLLNNAIDDYNYALQIDPFYAEAYKNRSYAYYQLGRFKEAWEDIELAKRNGNEFDQEYYESLKKANQIEF